MTVKKIFFLLWLSLAFATAKSQTTTGVISGKVLEAETDKPLSNVSIYFDGTLNGTSTDKTGSFSLYSQSASRIPMIVSAVGYETETIDDYPAGKKLLIYLKAKTYDLENVTITASDGLSRQEKLKIFRREFLGSSAAGRNCEILNEDDIRLTYTVKTNVVKAFSDNPIIVRNNTLGYMFSFILQDFSTSLAGTSFYGPQFFKEDPGDDKAAVAKAREKTYLGSKMHFIKSLANNDLAANNFKIFRKKEGDLPYDSIVENRDGQKFIRLKGEAIILYKSRQSFVQVDRNSTGISVDKDGYNNPMGIYWGGDMGRQRAADILPLDYSNELAVNLPPPDPGVKGIITAADTLRNRIPAEKLYLHFDKPYYSTGDTIWMKAYVFDAAFLSASKSGLVYLELANDTNKVLMRRMLPVAAGIGYGNLVLDTVEVPDGSYTIRAYTNLMRNFGEDLIFKKSFYVSRSSDQNWLVNSKSNLALQSGKNNLQIDLQLSRLNKEALARQSLDLRVIEGRRAFLRDKVETDADGKMAVNFNLPERSDPARISIVASDPKDPNRKVTIPVIINRPENIDLQFMPEGGNLIAGISSLVGFKAIGEDGRGTDVSGKIYNSRNEERGIFSSRYKGMGSFVFLPLAGEQYTAKITSPEGVSKVYPLPEIKPYGTALSVEQSKDSDTLSLRILIPPELSGTYYLIGQSRGIVCYGATIRQSDVKKISSSLFPSGIVRFSLLNEVKQPLNERIAYVDHKDNLSITVSPARASVGTRDSVTLNIRARDKDDQPVQGSFSIAVTDDNQVKADSLGGTILTTLLLTADLKGNVEAPGHYFQSGTDTWKDLDNLMLTQGWVSYTWKDVFNPPAPQYAVETEFTVRGRVSNVFNKGLKTGIALTSIRPLLLKDTITAIDGSFTFSNFPLADTLSFFIQARNKNSNSFNVGVEVDEFKPPAYRSADLRALPWYVNTDPLILNYVSIKAEKKQEELRLSGNVLGEVVITAKKLVRGSKNLNGVGNADIVLDEKDIGHYRTMTLYELLMKRFKYIYSSKVRGYVQYKYMQMPLVLLIDGDSFAPPEVYMENITAEDIVGIEVMSSLKFLYPNYMKSFIEASMRPLFILEVTTRAGHGAYAYVKNKPGMYYHKPMLLTGSKEFYSPKYAVKSPVTLTDLRSTIHWAPNIITDSEGNGTVSFYSADRASTYSIVAEGSDMSGHIGRQTGAVSVR